MVKTEQALEAAGGAAGNRLAGQVSAPPLELKSFSVKRDGGTLAITLDAATNDELSALFASRRPEFHSFIIGWLANLVCSSCEEDHTRNITMALSFIRGIAPRNEAEMMIALQMVAANQAGLELTRRTIKTDRVDLLTAYANAATKFQRTALAQVEALAKLRRNGEQVVKHVHVNDGGQAVIANTVNTGAGGHD